MDQPPPSTDDDPALRDPALVTATALHPSAPVPTPSNPHAPLSKDAANHRWAGSKIENQSTAQQPLEDSKEVATTPITPSLFLIFSFFSFSCSPFSLLLLFFFLIYLYYCCQLSSLSHFNSFILFHCFSSLFSSFLHF